MEAAVSGRGAVDEVRLQTAGVGGRGQGCGAVEGCEAAAAAPGEVCQQAGCLRQHRGEFVEGDGDRAMSGVLDNPSS